MPRFMVERDLGVVSEEEMQEIAARSRVMQAKQFPDIGWEGSHVCSDDGGAVKAFCVYAAPSPERLREHTDSVGGLVITRIYEIVGELSPDDVKI